MTVYEQVKEEMSEWELLPNHAVEAIEKIVEGIDRAIVELDNVGVDFSDLELLRDEWKSQKGRFEND